MFFRFSLFTLLLIFSAQAGDQKIAFNKNAAIYVAALDGSKLKKLTSGSWPDISPDGTHVAYNTEEANTPKRHIAVVEVVSGKKTIFKDIPSDNCHSPIWSPDGKQIAFYIYANDDWHLGLVHADGSGFRYVKKANPKHRSFWGAAWAADGKSFFCQDLENLYRIDLDGKVLQQWSLSQLFPTHGLNSGARLAPSPDGRTLLIDVDMAEDVQREDWDGPPPAIWQLDLTTGRVKQVTKTSLFAWSPAWINDREILCNHMPGGVKTIALYRIAVNGNTKPKLVIPNARDATASK